MESVEFDKVKSFLEKAKQNNKTVILVTSGGTSVPLELHTVRNIENFSTGYRGSISAEHFLK